MTTPTVSNAFITQFGDDVKEAYQRKSSKLRQFVRNRSFGPGEKTRFQAVGKATVSEKSRHGNITPSNPQHRYADCTMADYYGGEYCDQLDLEKLNIDERQTLINAETYAHGRKTDELLFTAMHLAYSATLNAATGATKYASSVAQTFTVNLVHAINELVNTNDVPDDSDRTWVVGVKTWTKLMQVEEFINADYVGSDALPFKGSMTVKEWLGWRWVSHSGMPIDGSSDERTLAFHKSAVGAGTLHEAPDTMVDWIAEKRSWFISSALSQGACVVDAAGAHEIVIDV
jgi:hypothetical protein